MALAEEQLEEEELEIEAQAIAQEGLAIGLTIACVLVILFFLVMSMVAHKMYRAPDSDSTHQKAKGLHFPESHSAQHSEHHF